MKIFLTKPNTRACMHILLCLLFFSNYQYASNLLQIPHQNKLNEVKNGQELIKYSKKENKPIKQHNQVDTKIGSVKLLAPPQKLNSKMQKPSNLQILYMSKKIPSIKKEVKNVTIHKPDKQSISANLKFTSIQDHVKKQEKAKDTAYILKPKIVKPSNKDRKESHKQISQKFIKVPVKLQVSQSTDLVNKVSLLAPKEHNFAQNLQNKSIPIQNLIPKIQKQNVLLNANRSTKTSTITYNPQLTNLYTKSNMINTQNVKQSLKTYVPKAYKYLQNLDYKQQNSLLPTITIKPILANNSAKFINYPLSQKNNTLSVSSHENVKQYINLPEATKITQPIKYKMLAPKYKKARLTTPLVVTSTIYIKPYTLAVSSQPVQVIPNNTIKTVTITVYNQRNISTRDVKSVNNITKKLQFVSPKYNTTSVIQKVSKQPKKKTKTITMPAVTKTEYVQPNIATVSYPQQYIQPNNFVITTIIMQDIKSTVPLKVVSPFEDQQIVQQIINVFERSRSTENKQLSFASKNDCLNNNVNIKNNLIQNQAHTIIQKPQVPQNTSKKIKLYNPVQFAKNTIHSGVNKNTEHSLFIPIRNICNMKVIPLFIECNPYKINAIEIESEPINLSTNIINKIITQNGIEDKELVNNNSNMSLEKIRNVNKILEQIIPEIFKSSSTKITCAKNARTQGYICQKIDCFLDLCDESIRFAEKPAKNTNLNLGPDTFGDKKNTGKMTRANEEKIEFKTTYDEPIIQYKKIKYFPYMNFYEKKINKQIVPTNNEPKKKITKKVSRIYYKDRINNKVYDVVSSEEDNKHAKEDVKIYRISDLLKGKYYDPCLQLFKHKIDKIASGDFAYCNLMEPANVSQNDTIVYLSEII